jgi:hypothetical protein
VTPLPLFPGAPAPVDPEREGDPYGDALVTVGEPAALAALVKGDRVTVLGADGSPCAIATVRGIIAKGSRVSVSAGSWVVHFRVSDGKFVYSGDGFRAIRPYRERDEERVELHAAIAKARRALADVNRNDNDDRRQAAREQAEIARLERSIEDAHERADRSAVERNRIAKEIADATAALAALED